MSVTKDKLRVIIVGGSVAGLTLAHGLHHHDIDYVVLEQGKDPMASHIGASIVVLPNGMRIMDQLGICNELLSMVDPLKNGLTWTEDGKKIVDADAAVLTAVRMGYPLAFMLRSELLRVIAKHLPDQSKLLTSKRVVNIEHSDAGVTVFCDDGTELKGDIVVGADGIRSTVRSKMQEHIEKMSPGSTKKDQDAISAEYNCIFGVSDAVQGDVTVGDCHRTYSKDHSTLAFIGKGKIFWFLFSKLDKRYYGEEIPRYSREDCAEHVKSFFDIHMTDQITFGQVWETMTYANMLCVEEMQIQHWTSDRFVCLGDASHKMTPNLGAGGNAAMESAAALTNSLGKLKGTKPSLSDIKTVLGEFYEKRNIRANIVCDSANQLTRIEALATLPDKLMGLYGIPVLGDFLADVTCESMTGAEKLDCLPIPARSLTATQPWDPESGIGKEEKKWMRALWALPLLAVLYGAQRTLGVTTDQILPILVEMNKKGGIELGNGQIVPVLAKYTGFAPLDELLRLLAAAFSPMIGDFDPVGRAQGMLFLADLVPIQAIWRIESIRRGNFSTAAHLLPTVMALAYQGKGIGFIAPIYFFLHYVQSPLSNYSAADNRMTQIGPAKTVIPTILLSYIIPCIAMFTAPGLANRQWINIVFYQPFPIYAAIIQRIIGRFVTDSTNEDRKWRPEADMPYLRRTYLFAATASALVYAYVHLKSPVSMIEAVFAGISNPYATGNILKDVAKMLRYDHIAAMGSGAIWAMLSFADLKKKGKLTASWAKIVGVYAGTALLAGPGAALATMWAWREECLPPKRSPVIDEA